MGLVVLIAAGTVARPLDQGAIAEVNALTEAYIRNDISPGLVLGIRCGETYWIEAFGVSDIETQAPLTSSHQFFVGSIAKQFTAAAVLRLVEGAKADLDAPITDYLPDAPAAWSGITIRHLLNHTSGIRSYGTLPHNLGAGVMPSEALIGFIAAVRPSFPAGERFVYSTSAYSVLAYIVEQITGSPFDDTIEQQFLAPLQMADTGYSIGGKPNHLAGFHQYYWQGAALFTEPPNTILGLGNGMYSTVADLFVWQSALTTGRVVSETTYAQMTLQTETCSAEGETSIHDYGFALELQVSEHGELCRVGHGGNAGGHIVFLWEYPACDMSIIALQNSNGMLMPLLREIEAILLRSCEEQ